MSIAFVKHIEVAGGSVWGDHKKPNRHAGTLAF
jgi:hypothetical protein